MASAASPAYCALYAREYANQMVQAGAPAGMAVSVEDQAYYRCLNQDEDPALPTASAYFGTDVDGTGDGSLDVISEGDASEGDTVAAPDVTDQPMPKAHTAVKTAPSKGRQRGGTLVAWSPEWVAKCKKYYPNSFDPETGMVLPYHASKRRFCPY
jgi:hypothetical protein